MQRIEQSARMSNKRLADLLVAVPVESWSLAQQRNVEVRSVPLTLAPKAIPLGFEYFSLLLARDLTGILVDAYLSVMPKEIAGSREEHRFTDSGSGRYRGRVLRKYLDTVMNCLKTAR